MAGRVELQGVEQMLAAIRQKMGDGAKTLENKALREGGEIFAAAQRESVAVSGYNHLHIKDDIKVSSVRSKNGDKYVAIGPGKATGWRAHFLEFGTSKMPAQPFIYPSFHEQKARVAQFMASEFSKAMQ
ncbi:MULTISPECIES: HK97-gp10 family putative phage morphogenesis protein [Paenibacillus]|uniref:HK97 gp10 family phage protein n=1 Tax=Paenibacillus pabuli TaxID=1472 RepID=A0A855Y3S0_9BACL|nr:MULTISPECIES: HK97-gp10 family putative phage morphogenesis protein [Paenibacillus]PWW37399.1 HK97 gp10 family phage protein [Paenibacillus pabuli]PXW05541.1 HK97 gp10 family phage protein [Paenibacillus taichungensis]